MAHWTNFSGRKRKPFRRNTTKKYRTIVRKREKNYRIKSRLSTSNKNNRANLNMRTSLKK